MRRNAVGRKIIVHLFPPFKWDVLQPIRASHSRVVPRLMLSFDVRACARARTRAFHTQLPSVTICARKEASRRRRTKPPEHSTLGSRQPASPTQQHSAATFSALRSPSSESLVAAAERAVRETAQGLEQAELQAALELSRRDAEQASMHGSFVGPPESDEEIVSHSAHSLPNGRNEYLDALKPETAEYDASDEEDDCFVGPGPERGSITCQSSHDGEDAFEQTPSLKTKRRKQIENGKRESGRRKGEAEEHRSAARRGPNKSVRSGFDEEAELARAQAEAAEAARALESKRLAGWLSTCCVFILISLLFWQLGVFKYVFPDRCVVALEVYQVGLGYQKAGDCSSAEKKYRHALKMNPDLGDAYVALGICLYQDSKEYNGAERAWREAIRLNSRNHLAHYHLAVLLHDVKKDLHAAESAYRNAAVANPRHGPSHASLGKILHSVHHNYDAAELEYRRAINAMPDPDGPVNTGDPTFNETMAISHTKLADILFNIRKDYTGAKSACQAALRLNSESASAHFILANVLYQTERDFAGAEHHYRETVRLKPSNSDAHYDLGELLIEVKNDDKAAEAEFKEVIKLTPKDAGPHTSLGNLLFESRDDMKGAETEIRKSLKLDPNFALAHFSMGRIKEKQHAYDRAVKEYRKALQMNPKLYSAHFYIGLILHQQGNYTEAENEYRAGLKHDKNALWPRRNLAFLLQHERDNLDAAKQMYREIIQSFPHDPLTLRSYGLVLELTGDNQVEAQYRKAIEADPNDPFSHTYLGRFLRDRHEDLKAARKCFKTAKAFSAQDSLARKFVEKIKKKSAFDFSLCEHENLGVESEIAKRKHWLVRRDPERTVAASENKQPAAFSVKNDPKRNTADKGANGVAPNVDDKQCTCAAAAAAAAAATGAGDDVVVTAALHIGEVTTDKDDATKIHFTIDPTKPGETVFQLGNLGNNPLAAPAAQSKVPTPVQIALAQK